MSLSKTFFSKNNSIKCDYVDSNIENFGVLLKGNSLKVIKSYNQEFDSCFIVSDFDDELSVIGNFLTNKTIIHFTNRSKQSSLSKSNYKKFKINKIQTGQVFRWKHFRLMETFFHYKKMFTGLEVYSLPEKMLKFNREFSTEYSLKFPNTGVLSLAYTLEMIKPKRLWVFGLDFYSVPYMQKQSQITNLSLNQQALKLDKLNIPNFVFNLFQSYPNTKIFVSSAYSKWPKINNVQMIN
ncbi:hypothetical protein N9L98_01845 [bacterium]|nr:hypothetical protein [bacterium]